MQESIRMRRVSDQVQKELSTIVQAHMRDTKLSIVTISAVDISRDLAHARIFFTYLETDLDHKEGRKEVTDNLNAHVAPFRHQLSKRLTTRIVPNLNFVFDDRLEQANRLTNLINTLNSSPQ